MAEYRVTCVSRTEEADSHYSIETLGGLVDYTSWHMTRSLVARAVARRWDRFYLYYPEGKIFLAVFEDEYVQTRFGGLWTIHLLRLPP
jgi:hypothetical protein